MAADHTCKIHNLQEHHKELFGKEEALVPKFIPRMCYKHDGVPVIGFYIKEVFGQTDIYTEFCSSPPIGLESPRLGQQ